MPLGQQQSVESLNFLLYRRALHPELFQIYQDVRIEQPRYEATIWITGCTHAVTVTSGTETLTELMAEEGDMLPERGLLASFRFRGEKHHEYSGAEQLRYIMSFQVESVSPRVYSQTQHELARSAGKHGLFVPFPLWQSSGLTPFSYVDYDAHAGRLQVFGYHAFPEVLTIVKTQSIFEID